MRESELAKIAAVAEIRRHDEMARRAEHREGDGRQKNRVETGDDRCLRDPRIAEHLRDVHRGERQPGEGVAQRLARLDWQEAAEDRKTHLLGAFPISPTRVPSLPAGDGKS